MLRYRRYRVFILFAVITIFLIYQFASGGGTQWDSGTYSADTIRQHLGLKSPKVNSNDHEAAAPDAEQRDRSVQKPVKLDIASETKREGSLSPPGYLEDAPRPKQELPKEKPSPKKIATPTVPAGLVEPADPASTAKDRENVVPGGTVASTVDESVNPLNPSMPKNEIATPVRPHFSKPSEHYPVESLIKLPHGEPKKIPRIQHDFEQGDTVGRPDEDKLNQIKEAFHHAWTGYRKDAWAHDELRPILGGPSDRFNGWGATLVDSLDTLYIMGMEEEFYEAVQQVEKIDFTTSLSGELPLFETTIRYLGGLLSAHDVSNGKYPKLLEKAEELGSVLYSAFDTRNRMPTPYYMWVPEANINPQRSSAMIVMAELGSLSMEFTRLAQLTKKDKYYDAIARVTNALDVFQKNTTLPGLWPVTLDASKCKDELDVFPSKPATNVSLEQANRKKFGNEEADAEAKEKALHLANAAALNKDPKKGKIGEALPAQVEFSRIKDHEEKIEVPPGYVEIERPKPIAFNVNGEAKTGPRKPGKVGEIKKVDGSTAKKNPPARGSVNDLKNAKPGRGKIQYIDMDKDGIEKPRAPVVARDSTMKPKKLGKRQLTPSLDQIGESPPRSALEETDEETLSDNSENVVDTVPKPVYGGHDSTLSPPATQQYTQYIKPEACLAELRPGSLFGSEDYSLAAMADSTYEYLPKEHILLSGLTDQYKEMYERAIPVAEKYVLFRPMLPDNNDILFGGKYVVKTSRPGVDQYNIGKSHLHAENTHLACFLGGMFGLGAKIFDRPEDMETAKKLTEGCVWAYFSTVSGVMPEAATFYACENKADCKWDETAFAKKLDPDAEERWATYEKMVAEREKLIAEMKAAPKPASPPAQQVIPQGGSASPAQHAPAAPQAVQQVPQQVGTVSDTGAVVPPSQGQVAQQLPPQKVEQILPQAATPGKDPAASLPQQQPQIAQQSVPKVGTVSNADGGQINPIAQQELPLNQAPGAQVADTQATSPVTGNLEQAGEQSQPVVKVQNDPAAPPATGGLRKRDVGTSTPPDQIWQPLSKSDDTSEDDDGTSEADDTSEDDEDEFVQDDGQTSNATTASGDQVGADGYYSQATNTGATAEANANAINPAVQDPTTLMPIEKPLTREEFVKMKIRDENLPAGYVSILDRKYMLRPEAIESVFYMHRITGDPHWREVGWRMFLAVENATRTDHGHSTIGNVLVKGGSNQLYLDEMQSFWTAETLKYFYLLFAGHDEFSLDEWVFNTEAHPFKRPDAPKNPMPPKAPDKTGGV